MLEKEALGQFHFVKADLKENKVGDLWSTSKACLVLGSFRIFSVNKNISRISDALVVIFLETSKRLKRQKK